MFLKTVIIFNHFLKYTIQRETDYINNTSMSKGGYVSFMAVYGGQSPKITAHELENAGILVDELISTVIPDANKTVSFIHTIKRVNKDTMTVSLGKINITGFECLIYTIQEDDIILENHPFFRILVKHESTRNHSFAAWHKAEKSTSSGFELLKSKIFRGLTDTNKGIYVLRVDNRPKQLFYVGKADDIERRIKQHSDGEGAYCITGEPFTRVEPVTKGSVDDMESWERNEVLTRMHEFGIDNVRGWMYTFKTMPVEQKVSAFDQICEKFDFCRKCGRNSHFIRDCHSMSTDLWTCGMELRPTYAGNQAANQQLAAQQSALDDASRRIAEAQEMITEAQRVLGGGV
jgi:hypothetical protein